MSEFGIEFLLLALRINKHIKGYVDFYFGPENLRQIVDNEALTSPKKLLLDAKMLLKQLGSQGYDKERERYLEKMLIAMRTSVEILSGIKIPIKEQISRLFDITLRPVNTSELQNFKEDFNEAYLTRRTGTSKERMNDLRMRRKVPEAKVFNLFKKALDMVETRTKELFVDLLPKKEHIFIDLVKNDNDNNIKWTCYEFYLGNLQSRLEINPNYNMYWTALLSLAAHEGYPGHHTHFSINEQRLYRELNQFEHSILLLHSPKIIICEGIADLALNVLFSSYREQAEISLREFCPDSSKEDSLEVLTAQNKVKSKVSLFWYDFAYHALIDGWNDKKLIQYANSFKLFSKENIKNQLNVISNPLYTINDFSYSLGSSLIINKYGEFPSVKNFRDMLVNPILPSDLI